MSISTNSRVLALRGAVVVAAVRTPTEELAARELARFLTVLTGCASLLAAEAPAEGACVILTSDPMVAASYGVAMAEEALGDEGFHLRAFARGEQAGVVVAADTPVGVLYGVYALLEELGMGFMLGGETYPDGCGGLAGELAADFDSVQRPAFSARGNMLHYNFLCGPTCWGLEDYQHYFDQLARIRCNLLLMHWYDFEPGAAYTVEGEYLAGAETPNSLNVRWGAIDALRTAQFSFGSGDYFDEEIFSSPMGERSTHVLEEITRTEAMFSEATRYAKRAGVRVAAGFEAPRGEPTDAETVRRFRARVRQFLRRNPHLSYFALWNHESGGNVGSALPEAGSAADALYQRQHADFAYLGNPMRVWEAIRYGEFARIALEVMREEAPRCRLALVGWGGDRWMLFADYCLGYDKLLPQNVVFTCHDNIIADIGPNVSTAWGQLPPERERWAMPWVECDLNDCWVRQPNVEALGTLAPDALQKGCQGLLTLQWRTRDVEEETGYIARYAWDTSLTPEAFYRLLARQMYGPDQEESMGEVIATLQRLGARWTGLSGATECGKMIWTGWEPHTPFEISNKTALFLRDFALRARDVLAEVPDTHGELNEDAGMFHHWEFGEQRAEVALDWGRPGVREYDAAAQRLEALGAEADEDRLRQGLREVEETILLARAELMLIGMPVKCLRAVDEFWLRLHHLNRHGSVSVHFVVLQHVQDELARLRALYLSAGRPMRLDRLESLSATIDFVLHFDQVAILLTDGELVETALTQAQTAHDAGECARASEIAGVAYSRVIAAGMAKAVEALTRKLCVRNDFGVLATVNVKALPLYWATIARLEAHMSAVPPREIAVRGDGKGGVWLSWEPSPRTTGYYLYRRAVGEREAQRVNNTPLQATTTMFLDHPAKPVAYAYTLTALDSEGRESPQSHRAIVKLNTYGAPHLIAEIPPSVHTAGQPLLVRVVARGECPVGAVRLSYRAAGREEWTTLAMLPRFRYSYQALIPAEALTPGMLCYYVEATDVQGRGSCWPLTAHQGVPWSVSVISEG